MAYFHFTKESNDIRLMAGDELRLKHPTWGKEVLQNGEEMWSCQGTVSRITSSEEVCLEIKPPGRRAGPAGDADIGPWKDELTTDFICEFVWKSTSFDRMQVSKSGSWRSTTIVVLYKQRRLSAKIFNCHRKIYHISAGVLHLHNIYDIILERTSWTHHDPFYNTQNYYR